MYCQCGTDLLCEALLLSSERALSNCSNHSATCLWSAFNSATASAHWTWRHYRARIGL